MLLMSFIPEKFGQNFSRRYKKIETPCKLTIVLVTIICREGGYFGSTAMELISVPIRCWRICVR